MTPWIVAGGVVVASLLSLLFSTLTYCLRDFPRAALETQLEKRGKQHLLQPTLDLNGDLIFVTALMRLVSNLLILIGVLELMSRLGLGVWAHYAAAVAVTAVITLFVSIAIPHALAEHSSATIVATWVRFLHGLRRALLPVTRLMHATDRMVAHLVGAGKQPQDQIEEEYEQEILSVVEEGEEQGVVPEQERELIKSVIEFGDTTAGQIMTARPEIIAVDTRATLADVRQVIEESGLSRIPVYEDSLDHIVGVLYARDLLKYVGEPPEKFNLRQVIRPAFFVPENRGLHDLLQDFRTQKVHLAIVRDEFGGTAGLVTIEDVLEQIVGEISDEHEPLEPELFNRLSETTAEADARIHIDQLNRLMQLDLPEDAGYETLGGFVSTTLGRIPEPGVTFEDRHARFTILDAEPQRVKRVRIELLPQPVGNVVNGK